MKNRIHFDLRPGERNQADEVERLKGFGAREVADRRGIYGEGSGWVILADPEGNEFCVLRARPSAPLRGDDSRCLTMVEPAVLLGYRRARLACFDGAMTGRDGDMRVVSASRDISAEASKIFELIADPALQPRWDGNDNLSEAAPGQRVHAVGDVFTMTTTKGNVRENHVVEFDEGRRIAWRPSEPGQPAPGHLWRWELEPVDTSRTLVTHTYDWTELNDERRIPRARATTEGKLQASLDRLASLAERL